MNAEGKNIDINNIACSVMYENDPLAMTTIGTEESIRKIDVKMLNEYFQNFCSMENMILAGAGAISHDKFFSLAEKYFDPLPAKGCIRKIQSFHWDTYGPCHEYLRSLDYSILAFDPGTENTTP